MSIAQPVKAARRLPSPARAPRLHTVLNALQEHGPMSTTDIAEVLGWTAHKVSAIISPTRANYPGLCFRIVRYLPVEGEWRPYVAIYGPGPGPDARLQTKAERMRAAQRRYRQKFGTALRARDRLRRSIARSGAATAVNPWMQLAPRALRARMGQVAANTSMAVAA